MRRLLIIAALCSVLFATSPPVRPVPGRYQCREDQDGDVFKEAELFINEQHRHGYKFKFVSVDSRTVEKQGHPCLLNLELTLEETSCHVLNPTPLDKCSPRERHEVKVEAKCNVTICGGANYPGIKRYSCKTTPESSESIHGMCPDCPTLLPLDDKQALEAIHDAIKKFNKDSTHTSHFKLLEVGRTLTYYIPQIGMNFASEFAIVETECSDKETAEDSNCEQKCSHEADHGFCKSTKLGNGELTLNCTIYDNSTSSSHIPFLHEKRCEKHKDRPGPPGHQDRHTDGPVVSLPGQPGIKIDVPYGCYFSLSHPDHPHGGRHHHHHHHGGHHHGVHHHGGHHHGGPHDKKHKEHKDHPHGKGHCHDHGHNHDHSHEHKELHPPPTGPPTDNSTNTECPGFAQSHPYIHPICSFPPTFYRRGHKLPEDLPASGAN